MKATTLLFAACAAAAFAGPAHAVFKCTTVKGVVYQDRPCLEGNETDVRLTVPTGEVAPTPATSTDDPASGAAPRSEDRTRSVKLARNYGDAPAKTGQRTEQKTDAGATDANRRRTEAPLTAERTSPMSAEQARQTEPSAKYYSTEAFGAGNDTPMQMNCESPSGERRTFYLTNGKLTSI